jgi:hypothetical protein
MRKQKPPQFTVGDNVEYFRRGICYPGVVREDLGVLKGAGRRYHITRRNTDDGLVDFAFDVAERHLSLEEEYWIVDHPLLHDDGIMPT